MSLARRWMSQAGADPDFVWTRQGRSASAIAIVAGIWLCLAASYVVLDAAPWLVGVLGLFTLPALYDIVVNPEAGLRLDMAHLSWFSGRRAAQLSFDEISHIRLDRRLDLSTRVTAVLQSGRKIRLPFECTPPPDTLEAELRARGIRAERHPFSPIG